MNKTFLNLFAFKLCRSRKNIKTDYAYEVTKIVQYDARYNVLNLSVWTLMKSTLTGQYFISIYPPVWSD